ncbi:hypothetical protein EDD53_2393 [Pacificibacter maritimus]|uniref:Uncharacterized protein n=1 Tax=Pacificibacter maritimus TaxID=762213 RepID=A0A3N4UVA4_9RHOB|nr:hypothetical protein EDD53_2393 [Pacificibacter maritimus]
MKSIDVLIVAQTIVATSINNKDRVEHGRLGNNPGELLWTRRGLMPLR